MGLPQFRFTLQHAQLGTKIISEPDGWKDAKLKLERHPDFHSLVEYFEGTFIFYGRNGVVDGGIDFIKNVENRYGFDTELKIIIDVSFDDGQDYENIFTGQLDLSQIQELKNNKLSCPIIRNDFWSKFIGRRETPVNLKSTTSLGGQSVSAVGHVTVQLPNQKIRYYGDWEMVESVTYEDVSSQWILQIDFEQVNKKDITKFNLPRTSINVNNPINYDLIPGLIEAPWDGYYAFDIRIESSRYDTVSGDWVSSFAHNFKIQKAGQPVFDYFTATTDTYGSDTIKVSTYSKTLYLNKGDQVAIYCDRGATSSEITIFGNYENDWKTICAAATTGNISLSGEQTIDGVALTAGLRCLVKDQTDPSENGIYDVSAGAWTRSSDSNTSVELQNASVLISGAGTTNGGTYWRQTTENVDMGNTPITFSYTHFNDTFNKAYPGTTPNTYLRVTADTIFRKTDSEAFLLHDTAAGIVSRIIDADNKFYSEYLGSTLTNSRTYASNGCAWNLAVIQGLQLKGYTLSEKQFAMSLDKWWSGANPILNLGLGYETVSGVEVIRIERKADFYNRNANPSVYIDNVREIIRDYELERVFNKVELGYIKWESEDVSGIDDPQTKRIYSTSIQKTKNALTLYSEFIAASLAIEVTRRKSVSKTTDWRLDNDVFIIELNPDDVSTDTYNPLFDENFSSVSNLINPESRYNLLLTPARSLLRWLNYITIGLDKYMTSSIKFVSGEGNYDMTADFSGADLCFSYTSNALSEKADISLSTYGNIDNGSVRTRALHLPQVYTIEIGLSWDDYTAIRTNRKNPIAISQTTTGHKKFFIKDLEYEICNSKCTMKVWPAEQFSINVITTEPGEYEQNGCPVIRDYIDTLVYNFDSDLDGWENEGDDIDAPTLEALANWDNAPGIAGLWALGAHPSTTQNGGGDISGYIRGEISTYSGVSYDFDWAIDISGADPTTGNLRFYILDGSNNILASQVVPFVSNGYKTGTVTLTPSSNGTYFAIKAENTTPFASKTFTIDFVTVDADPIIIPEWAWNSAYSGSAKASTSVENFGVKNLVINGISLPQLAHTIEIKYAVENNNSSLSLRFKIKDSGGSTLQNQVFETSPIPSGEHTALIFVTSSSVWQNADKFEILVESSDFDTGDNIYITKVRVYYEVLLS